MCSEASRIAAPGVRDRAVQRLEAHARARTGVATQALDARHGARAGRVRCRDRGEFVAVRAPRHVAEDHAARCRQGHPPRRDLRAAGPGVVAAVRPRRRVRDAGRRHRRQDDDGRQQDEDAGTRATAASTVARGVRGLAVPAARHEQHEHRYAEHCHAEAHREPNVAALVPGVRAGCQDDVRGMLQIARLALLEALQKRGAPFARTAGSGAGCGRPSGRTVEIRNSSATADQAGAAASGLEYPTGEAPARRRNPSPTALEPVPDSPVRLGPGRP